MVDQWSSSSSGFSLWVYSVTDVRNSCERPRAVGHKYLKPGNPVGLRLSTGELLLVTGVEMTPASPEDVAEGVE